MRELILTRRQPTEEEVELIMQRIAEAPFMGEVPVGRKYRGLEYMGREVKAREDSRFYHLARRVVADGQWAYGTTEEEYEEDLRRSVSDPSSRLALYARQGGHVAASLSVNAIPEERRGPNATPYLFVVYSADRGRIVSGYQASGPGEVDVSEDPLWIR